MKYLPILVLICMATCCFAGAKTGPQQKAQTGTRYYVATAAQGGNDNNAGTALSAPFATVSKALLSAVNPGDAIFVRSGTYTLTTTVNITKAGTAARHIVLSVYKPDMKNAKSRPVFDCSSMTIGNNNKGFILSGASYWDIYGIVIKGAGDNGMYVTNNTGNTTITFCDFTRNRDTGLQLADRSHDIQVINCDSYENADRADGTRYTGGNADGFAPKMDVGDNIWFRGCRAWENSDDGWDGYLRGASENMTTYLEDCWAFRNGYYWLDGSTNSSQNGNGFKMGGSDTKDRAHNFVLVKCLSFDNKARGFDQNSNAGSIYLYNCTAYRNQGSDYGLNSTTSRLKYKAGAELVLKNNLSLGAKGVDLPAASTPARKLVTENNFFLTAASSPEILSMDTAGVTGMRNPDGSLPALKFMHLKTSASQPYTYINKGILLPDVEYHQKKGIPYKGKSPDLGAFEAN